MISGPYRFTFLEYAAREGCYNKCRYKLNLSYQPASEGSIVCLPPPVMCQSRSNYSAQTESSYRPGSYNVEIHNNLDYLVMVTVLAIPNMSFKFPVRRQSEGAVSIPKKNDLHSVTARSDTLNIDWKSFVTKHPLPPKRLQSIQNLLHVRFYK